MRARGVRLKGVQGFGDISLDFRGSDGRVLDLIILSGGFTSAKGYIARSFFEAFGRSVSRRESTSKWEGGRSGEIWLDFDLGAEIAAVRIDSGKVYHSNAIFGASSFSLESGGQYADGCCLLYDSRIARLNEAAGNPAFGVIWPLIYEAHRRQIKSSMIIVDDFDALLSADEAREVLQHLLPLMKARGNQLVLTTPHSSLRKHVPEGSWFELADGQEGLLKGVLKDVQRAR